MRSTRSRCTTLFATCAGGALALTAALSGTAMGAQQAPPQPAQDPIQTMAAACNDGWLCVWEGDRGQGKRHDFFKCDFHRVQDVGLSRVGSFVNNQYDGTVAHFFGPGGWHYASHAPEIRENDQGHFTDALRVC